MSSQQENSYKLDKNTDQNRQDKQNQALNMSGNLSLSTLEESKLMSNSPEMRSELDLSPIRKRERRPEHVRSICAAIKGLNKENTTQKPKCYNEENEAVNYFRARMLSPGLNNSFTA